MAQGIILGRDINRAMIALGDWSAFAGHALRGLVGARTRSGTLISICYSIGVMSVPVIVITGFFIGMVLAVQAYAQYHNLGLDTWLGSMIHQSVIRELGPVLAAVMLAGRVGSAMAAELGTMKVTEQIDALACLGVDPVHYLVVPRFLACVLLIPLLTVLANVAGVIGAAVICLSIYHIDAHHYWQHGRDFIDLSDVILNLIKPVFFGAFIALISCHRGFRCRGGSEGVGRASTEAFVWSFLAILVLDFFLGLTINSIKSRWLDLDMVKLTS
ncbi:MAG: ABC transporter permease [Gemmataceae bacterium]|nr:ABC transporter permease [Gemmataceae bacterium]